jgi:hypothetical protein
MSSIADVISRYRAGDCAPARMPEEVQVASTVEEPATSEEIASAWGDDTLTYDPGAQVADLWRECREASLFEDLTYGQWGLRLLSPEKAARRTAEERQARPSDVHTDDIILGEFLGDADLLVVAPSESDPQRRLLVALPLDSRPLWPGVGPSLADFLDEFCTRGGEKFWE